MDMRSLDNSLPAASPAKQHASEPILDSFKAAALAVTKLYKTAAADQGRARSEGYQDCLDELLAYLDKGDIGLSDGEGWRIRRWATERLDGRAVTPTGMETDDEAAEKTDRCSSPEIPRSHSASRLSPIRRTASPPRAASQPPVLNTPAPTSMEPVNTIPPQGAFSFRSSFAYPQAPDISLSELDLSDTSQARNDGSSLSHASNPPITITRPHRTTSRHSNHNGRPSGRTAGALTRGAGQKRKINPADFFPDFSNPREYRDGKDGGGKRGRYA